MTLMEGTLAIIGFVFVVLAGGILYNLHKLYKEYKEEQRMKKIINAAIGRIASQDNTITFLHRSGLFTESISEIVSLENSTSDLLIQYFVEEGIVSEDGLELYKEKIGREFIEPKPSNV